jgi:hypothetical protein
MIACTGVDARWCPEYGTCVCSVSELGFGDLDDQCCPLHSASSTHGDAERQATAGQVAVYVASKASHRKMWRRLRDELSGEIGLVVNSTWIEVDDGARELSAGEYKTLWLDCMAEVEVADALVLYSEPGEELKGALVEAGAALAHGLFVVVAGVKLSHSWLQHPNVAYCPDVKDALRLAYAAFQPSML